MTDEHPHESPPVTAAPARRRLRPFVAVAVLVGAVGVALAMSSESPRAVVADAGGADPTTTAPPEPEPTTTTAAPTITTTVAQTTTTAPARVEPRATKTGTPAVPPRPGVRLTLRLDRATVVAGEEFVAVLVIENGSSEDLVYSGNACEAYHYGLYRDGSYVGGDPARACPAIDVPPVVVPPGAVKEAQLRFTTDGNHYDAATGTVAPLPPGVFQVGAGIHQRDADNRDVAWFAPAVDIEIRAAS